MIIPVLVCQSRTNSFIQTFTRTQTNMILLVEFKFTVHKQTMELMVEDGHVQCNLSGTILDHYGTGALNTHTLFNYRSVHIFECCASNQQWSVIIIIPSRTRIESNLLPPPPTILSQAKCVANINLDATSSSKSMNLRFTRVKEARIVVS